MFKDAQSQTIPLPKCWTGRIRSAVLHVLHVLSLAKYSLIRTQGWAANSVNPRLRRQADLQRLELDLLQLREELRIKDARMGQLPPQRRPHYPPVERMSILELRAVRGWSLAQTARAFLVTEATISSWMRRLDEQGPDALVQLREPVNKFPDFVHYLVLRLRALCPTLGKVKIAQILARAGLHLSATSVGRMVKSSPYPAPAPMSHSTHQQIVRARGVNHVWHVDLTTVPTAGGFWSTLLPMALPQSWPFCWWLAVVVDHYSRRVMGTGAFTSRPTSLAVRAVLKRAMQNAGVAPKHLICDRGVQFDCRDFRSWCRRRTIGLRFGAVGRHGSIALIERCIRTLKKSFRQLPLVPQQRQRFQREVAFVVQWYNQARPHSSLCGRTPDEVYFKRYPATRRPRWEPRSRWPRGTPCARPWALTRGRPGVTLALDVEFLAGRRHLPVVSLKRAA